MWLIALIMTPLVYYGAFLEQTFCKRVILTLNSIRFLASDSQVCSRSRIWSIVSKVCWRSDRTAKRLAHFVSSSLRTQPSCCFCTCNTAPFPVRDFDKLIQKNLIVLVDGKIAFSLLEIVCPLLFIPHFLWQSNNILAHFHVGNRWRSIWVLKVWCRISLLNLI